MESQDLRIGNLFYKIDRTQQVHMPIEVPMVVAEIGIPFVKFYPLGTPIEQVTKYFDVELFSMTPIPLTEEWLLKFGFEWSIYHQANHKEGFRFDISEKHNDGYTLHLFKKKEIIVESFYFVHQLQNLYYALTQTELTINN